MNTRDVDTSTKKVEKAIRWLGDYAMAMGSMGHPDPRLGEFGLLLQAVKRERDALSQELEAAKGERDKLQRHIDAALGAGRHDDAFMILYKLRSGNKED